MESEGKGSSLAENKHHDNRSGKWFRDLTSSIGFYRPMTVQSANASLFLRAVRKNKNFAFLNRFEGYENELLPDMLDRGGSCGQVDTLACEWHSRVMLN